MKSPEEIPHQGIETEDSERGSAMIEFIALSVMLFIPTVYFLLTVFSIQAAGFAAAAASQQGIMVVRNMGEERAVQLAQVQAAAALAAEDYGVAANQIQVQAHCLTAECDRVQVATSVTVDLPLIPWVAPQGIGTMSSEATWWGGKYR